MACHRERNRSDRRPAQHRRRGDPGGLMEQQVLAWITQYGYIAIYALLVFGIVGLPVPDETLMTFTGYLVYTGHLSLVPAWLAAFCGSASGITISYILGRTFGLAL